MSVAGSIKASYISVLKETVTVRRYSGLGASRVAFDAPDLRARVANYDFQSPEVISTVTQGDQTVIVLADDLEARGISLPLTTDDKVLVAGKEKKIMNPRPRTAPDGTIVAYELRVRG